MTGASIFTYRTKTHVVTSMCQQATLRASKTPAPYQPVAMQLLPPVVIFEWMRRASKAHFIVEKKDVLEYTLT